MIEFELFIFITSILLRVALDLGRGPYLLGVSRIEYIYMEKMEKLSIIY